MTDGAALRGDRFLARLVDAVGTAVVGADEPLRLLAVTVIAGGHALLEDVPGVGKTLIARAFAGAVGMSVRPHPGHAGPAADRRDRLLDPRARRLPLRPRTDLRQRRPRRRGQPRDAPHAVGPARGDAGAAGVGGGRDAPAARPVRRPCHPEPDRAGGHVLAPRGAARSLPRADPARLSGGGGRATDRAPPPGRERAARCGHHRRAAGGARRAAGGGSHRARRARGGGLHRRPRARDPPACGRSARRIAAGERRALPRGPGRRARSMGATSCSPTTSASSRRPCSSIGSCSTSTASCAAPPPTAVIADVLDSIELQVEPQEVAAAGEP